MNEKQSNTKKISKTGQKLKKETKNKSIAVRLTDLRYNLREKCLDADDFDIEFNIRTKWSGEYTGLFFYISIILVDENGLESFGLFDFEGKGWFIELALDDLENLVKIANLPKFVQNYDDGTLYQQNLLKIEFKKIS